MKLNDKITLSVAEAVKQVVEDSKDFKPHTMYDPKTGKAYEAKSLEDHLKMKDMGYTHEKPSEKNETEVQDSDKDFVDLHSVDKKKNPEKERQVEETEVEDEDEVEEGNAFGQAVTDAKKAGKKKFKFQGKEYKVESVELEKANVLSSDEYDEVSNFKNFNKKDWQWNAIQKKFVRKVKVKEDADLKEAAKPSNGKSTVGLDVVDAKSAMKDMKKFKLKAKEGKGNGSADEVIVTGKNADIFKYLTSDYYDMDTDEIEEFYPELFESVDLEEAVNRNKPDDVRDAYGEIELTYRNSGDRRDVAALLKKAGINVNVNDDTLETDSNSPAFRKAGITKTFDSSKREKMILKLLGESVDLEEATMSQGVKTAATQIYSLEKSLKAGSNLNKGVNKSLEGKYDADFKKMQKAIGDIVSVWEEIERDFSDMNESADLEEAVTPADFVKGGDTKVTKREVDGMLSKLFIDTKLAKAVEANSAFKAGEKSNGKKNPYKKDTADFHLFILGQQSADADS